MSLYILEILLLQRSDSAGWDRYARGTETGNSNMLVLHAMCMLRKIHDVQLIQKDCYTCQSSVVVASIIMAM